MVVVEEPREGSLDGLNVLGFRAKGFMVFEFLRF
jgi:hypothetical protein